MYHTDTDNMTELALAAGSPSNKVSAEFRKTSH